MQLPRELNEWAPLLSLFPRELALAMGGMVRRLAAVIGPLGGDVSAGPAEPDGYAGLTSRGGYERLLASEWLLAEEMPHEFDRRAVMGEHLFLKRALLEPKTGSACVVLFDAGPGQLGSPRIVHLALLILLARRAQAAGTRFQWGILQEPDGDLSEVIDESHVHRLLRARTAQEVTCEQKDAWQERLQATGERSELWIAGDPDEEHVPLLGHRIAVSESWTVDSRALNVEVIRGGHRQTLELELPPDDACVRLLRYPFRPAGSAPVEAGEKLATSGGLLFSRNGKKLAVRLENGDLAVYAVPNSSTTSPGKPRILQRRNDSELLAIDLIKKRIATLSVEGDELVLRQFPGLKAPLSIRFDWGLYTGSDHLRRCYWRSLTSPDHCAYVIDGSSRLLRFYWSEQTGTKHAQTVLPNAVAASWSGNWVACVTSTPSHGLKLHLWNIGGTEDDSILLVRNPHTETVHWVWTPHFEPEKRLLQKLFVACNVAPGLWQVRLVGMRTDRRLSFLSETDIQLDPDDDVVGLLNLSPWHFTEGTAESGSSRTVPSLIVLNKARSTVSIRSDSYRKTVREEAEEIVSVAVDSQSDQIAWMTRSGGLNVYSVSRRQMLLRVRPGAQP